MQHEDLCFTTRPSGGWQPSQRVSASTTSRRRTHHQQAVDQLLLPDALPPPLKVSPLQDG
jgi:hypothetical protein